MSDFIESSQAELLICGYVRQFEITNHIYITSHISQLILSFFHVLPIWDIYDAANYQRSKNGYVITSINTFPGGLMTGNCFESLIYPQCSTKNGYNKNTHYFSIQNETSCGCSHHFGVTTKRDKNDLSYYGSYNLSQNNSDKHSVYEYFCTKSPNKSVVITIKLDCINWCVTWFVNNIETYNKQIEANMYYYFVLKSCARDHTPMRIVHTDISYLQTLNAILNNDRYRQTTLSLLTSNSNKFIKYLRSLLDTKETCQPIWRQCAGYWGDINSTKFMDSFWILPITLFKMNEHKNESWTCVKCKKVNKNLIKCSCSESVPYYLNAKQMKEEYLHLAVWIIAMYGKKQTDGILMFTLKQNKFKDKIMKYVQKYVEMKGLSASERTEDEEGSGSDYEMSKSKKQKHKKSAKKKSKKDRKKKSKKDRKKKSKKDRKKKSKKDRKKKSKKDRKKKSKRKLRVKSKEIKKKC